MGLTVGIREFKARLSHYLKQVKAGATLVITERGEPVGQVIPMALSPEERMREWVAAGLAAWSGRRFDPPAPTARPEGPQTVADLLLEDRE